MPPLFTIGYERVTQAEVVGALTGAGVELLVDVRAVAASRRAGFSKSVLRAGVEEAGIAYLHLRDLGTPKAGRDAARAGRCEEMREVFAVWLEEPAATAAFERLAEEAGSRRVCLLCFEADPSCCRRQVLAERLVARSPRPVHDLVAAPRP